MDENCAQEVFGQICWLEVPIKDLARARKFYTTVFGWDCDAEPAPNSPSMPPESPFQALYFFRKGKALNGAFMLGNQELQVINHDQNRPRALPLLPSLCVKDCESTLNEVEGLGGKTQVSKTAIGGGMGFWARLIDTEGNLVGIWWQD